MACTNASEPDASFVDLRWQRVDRVKLLVQHIVDCHDHVRRERIRTLKVVGIVEERGIRLQRRRSGQKNGTVTMKAASCTNTPVYRWSG